MALLSVMLFSFYELPAQVMADTLKEVEVKDKKQISGDDRLNIFSPGQKIRTIDSITLEQYKFQSVANLLSQQTSAFVKSYGFNGLATLNFRGASAAQSQVYWNGVPLQNAALGISDVSLLPVSLMNEVNIVYGGSSALWGSGNVGGALVVANEQPCFDENGHNEYAISAVSGSFSQYRLGLKTSVSSKKFYLSANAFGQSAKNNFSYATGDRYMTNASLRSGVGLLQAACKINEKNTLKFHGWYQQYYREIPPALFESFSVKNQRDESLRLLFDWDQKNKRATLYAKMAFISDRMLYRDTVISLRSDNVTNQLYAEVGLKYRLNRHHRLMLFAPMQTVWINRQTSNDVHYQNRIAIAGAWAMQHFNDKLELSVNARGEQVNNISIFLPGINAGYKITGWLSLRGNVQKSYRAPTLNEMYYVPGGNDRLKPEQGWSEDAGYTVRVNRYRPLSVTHDLSFFSRIIKDWVLWFGGAVWTPHNIATVHSRGVETENTIKWDLGNWKLHLGVNTSYVLATTVESYFLNDGSIGKQIPYSPRYNFSGNIGFRYKGFYFNYNYTYTGYRFVTVDESQYLEPYATANIQVLYSTYVKRFPLQINVQINNLLNSDYAVVNGRPMPGINWLAGARFTFVNR